METFLENLSKGDKIRRGTVQSGIGLVEYVRDGEIRDSVRCGTVRDNAVWSRKISLHMLFRAQYPFCRAPYTVSSNIPSSESSIFGNTRLRLLTFAVVDHVRR